MVAQELSFGDLFQCQLETDRYQVTEPFSSEGKLYQCFGDASTEGDRHKKNVEIYKKLFSYRYAGIMATKLEGGDKPRWFERKYIADQDYERLGGKDFFLGVGFDKTTEYALFDIDRGSLYHPENNQTEFNRFLEWLESIGCVAPLIVQSSFSEGLHVYFIFPKPFKTYNLACTLRDEAIAAGFEVKKGQLEIFPNPKNREARYMKHRLPLQDGSFILDSDLNPISDSIVDFERHWQFAVDSNDLALLRAAMKRSYLAFKGIKSGDRPYFLTPKQQKLKNDLEAYIAGGWTGHGQTEEILRRIARHTAIFANGGKGVADLEEGTRIALEMAMNAPGVAEWCRNHPDYMESSEYPKEGQTLEVRIRGWMKCALRQYNPVMVRDITKIQAIRATLPEKDLTPQERKQDALERQKKAVDEAIAQNLTFKNKTELMRWLVRQAKSSFQTLQKNWIILWEKVKGLIISQEKQPEADQDKSFSLSPKLSLFVLKVSCNSLLRKDSSDSTSCSFASLKSCNPSYSQGSEPIQGTCININVFCNSYGVQNRITYLTPEQNLEKKYLIIQDRRTSSSAGFNSSSVLINLVDQQVQKRDLLIALGDFSVLFGQSTAFLESESAVQAIACEKIIKANRSEKTIKTIKANQNESTHQEISKSTGTHQPKINEDPSQLTASEKNSVTENDQKLPKLAVSKFKLAVPKFFKGQLVWFWNGVKWLQGTIELVMIGVRNEYNVLDSRGWGLFVPETAIAPI